jgi:hypothetical protein
VRRGSDTQSQRSLTFRATGIPLDWSVSDLNTWLRTVLPTSEPYYDEQHSDFDFPKVVSLFPEVGNRSQTATIADYGQIEQLLAAGWRNQQDPHITLDREFYGLTTLYQSQEPRKVEYAPLLLLLNVELASGSQFEK